MSDISVDFLVGWSCVVIVVVLVVCVSCGVLMFQFLCVFCSVVCLSIVWFIVGLVYFS